MTLTFPAIDFYMMLLGNAAKRISQKKHSSFVRLSNHFIDTLRGVETLKAFGRSKEYGSHIFSVSESFRRASIKGMYIGTTSSLVLDLTSTLSMAGIAFMLGIRLLEGNIDLLPALTILILTPSYYKPLKEFGSDYHASVDGKTALCEIQSIINQAYDASCNDFIPRWDKQSQLSIKNLNFCRKDDGFSLQNISLEFKGFEKIALIGPSGQGKSTLLQILAGFIQAKSDLLEINGKRYEHLMQDEWQSQLIYIPQDPYIFSASIKDNLRFYTPDSSDQELMHALEIVGLSEFVNNLKDGLDTIIGDGGKPLSGGQSQRISLARAFLDKDRRILILDEPSAHLDIESEFDLKEKMLNVMKDRLVIFSTHRTHWLERMDRVVSLQDGCIVSDLKIEDYENAVRNIEDCESVVNQGSAKDTADEINPNATILGETNPNATILGEINPFGTNHENTHKNEAK